MSTTHRTTAAIAALAALASASHAQWTTAGNNVYLTGGNVGIGTTNPGFPLDIRGNSLRGIFVVNNASSGATYGVYATALSDIGRGIYGLSNNPTGNGIGVYGVSNGVTGRGVTGYASNAGSGATYGVFGSTNGTGGAGVYGSGNQTVGVLGTTDATNHGSADGSTSAAAIRGIVNSTGPGEYSAGVWGINNSTTGNGIGVAGYQAGSGWGVYGHAAVGDGVYGECSATTGTGAGGYFYTSASSGYGVVGTAGSTTGSTTAGLFRAYSNTGTGVFGYASNASGITFGVVGQSSSASGYDFFATGAGVDYGTISSRRWKRDITNIPDPLDKLAKIRGVYYTWDEAHGGTHDVGFVAEEVGAVLPEIVAYEENGVDATGMDYGKVTPLLVEAVNTLRAEKDNQLAERDARIETLEQQNAELQARLARVEAMMVEISKR